MCARECCVTRVEFMKKPAAGIKSRSNVPGRVSTARCCVQLARGSFVMRSVSRSRRIPFSISSVLCVCVCKREREREREGAGGGEDRMSEEREREQESKRARERERFFICTW